MIMDLICSLICIFTSFSLFSIYVRKWKYLKKLLLENNEDTILFDLLLFICFVKIGLYYCLPSITHAISCWKPVYEEAVSPWEVTIVYLIEFVSYLIFIYTIQLYIKRKKPNITISEDKSSNWFIIGLLGLAALYYVNSISVKGEEASTLDSFWFIMPFVRNCGIFLILYIITIGTKIFSKLIVFCAIITLIPYLAFAITAGVRSLLVWPIVFLMYFTYKYNKEKLKIFLPIGLASVILMSLFQDSLVAMRGQDARALEKVANMKSSNNISDTFEKLFEEIDYRFGAMTTYGVGYVRLVQQGKSAGLNPIVNSLYAPLPRRFFENKPIACSYDGTEYGQGMYMAMEAASKNVTYSMTEPATGAHAYWELGILGIIILSIIPAIYVMFCIGSFRRFGILAIPLFLVIFKCEYLEPKLWVSCIILQFFQVNIPVYFIKKFYLKYGIK